MKTYDIASGDFGALIDDLEEFKKQLIQFNEELVDGLTQDVLTNVMMHGQEASEPEQREDVINRNRIENLQSSSQYQARLLINDSYHAVFAEFGYGIIGKASPYQYNDFLKMSDAGWKGYDLNTIYKRPDRSWFYVNRYGEQRVSSGATPKNIFYKSTRETRRNLEKIVNSIFKNRW